ncbi:hypothetical protein COCC4DRAFT_199973 [Bipolaris maydis ATCC 48331]|uniref:Uncharacterized protein n=2 Tax=Cochliobolus heterostrophus TaxID=5016 RepID=M2TMS6_COCH5|nr:uncharacterized protein COCC4DRAFT_199973 [Bipolaris maydis ATCC 48331]EMD87824.1 hypothetical protein COCHEDRAFT_1227125 [Bipolaris maydis C5]KAJ5020394.1 hypothetical protein J3E73DRAFT_222333 [Bipolaris maydis]ENI03338.1 hypothetical protein COCC4DRAFT_199973 [Bipolaris maydis ATCC 48331]KAJ5020446.1 hypothetical protein J3E73DRAFT_361926 [Bipolaris maydis]KAJ5057511.1 hypothetical protein J3E74DRAFT_362765 [Bipolaris maydis]
MSPVPWEQEINFASALLLHSCITVFLKEISNGTAILYHIFILAKDKAAIDTSVMLDGYTSVFSRDQDGELAELYFTNSGFVLLICSLASAITMNLALPTGVLNALIAATFGLTFLASAAVACKKKSFVMPIMALRRAGRFIWSDTPFVNFFSLIYIAVVLKGSSRLALKDYVIFRSIAILELVFMKARLAAADAETQQVMLKRLVDSEYAVISSKCLYAARSPPKPLEHSRIVPFMSSQRLMVMLYKTAIGHIEGSVCGASGPATMAIPKYPGFFKDEAAQYGWRVYRVSPTYVFIEDCGQTMVTETMKRAPTKERTGMAARYTKFISWSHGVLLRRLGRRRVVWLMQTGQDEHGADCWKGNINLVTGLKEKWLNDRGRFRPMTGDDDGDARVNIVW